MTSPTSRRRAAVAILIALAGCTFEGRVDQSPTNIECLDTRDGERFSFNTTTITNVRIGMAADTCMNLVDDSGRERTHCKSEEAYIKCEAKP